MRILIDLKNQKKYRNGNKKRKSFTKCVVCSHMITNRNEAKNTRNF